MEDAKSQCLGEKMTLGAGEATSLKSHKGDRWHHEDVPNQLWWVVFIVKKYIILVIVRINQVMVTIPIRTTFGVAGFFSPKSATFQLSAMWAPGILKYALLLSFQIITYHLLSGSEKGLRLQAGTVEERTISGSWRESQGEGWDFYTGDDDIGRLGFWELSLIGGLFVK